MEVFSTSEELGRQAARQAGAKIVEAIKQKDIANIILATGASQFETLKNLVSIPKIDWSKVEVFHLDEYISLPESHPASFRNYLRMRFVQKVSKLKSFHYIQGDSLNPQKECDRLNKIISKYLIDVALIGIGENGHLAFNDPPADFETEQPYIIVDLNESCRKQQLREGWFKRINEVPKRAISMSVNQILKSKTIICSVPEERKAEAVYNCLTGMVSNLYPASVLQQHSRTTIYLDRKSASKLTEVGD